ncbi:unnamed protein product [Candida verbasci]|uniref:Uracil-DNA glycosylase-like domain-containing protein n=1 Tax=Candida verbasci TaxID=1227364 RepID=A0A9W4TW57_9ASCO|nr:unnamed protein product [Candida verbasci]
MSLKSIIQSYKYTEDEDIKVEQLKTTKVTSPKKIKKTTKDVSPKKKVINYTQLQDLQPSLKPDLKLLFIGFNPGVESSLTQHHYAHHSNLFWKLFNQSQALSKVTNGEFSFKCTSELDFELIKYSIGFSDLCLRCTKQAHELTNDEKLENVPRLYTEIKDNNVKNVVIIGKGVWEMIVKYEMLNMGKKKFKLSKDNFVWGEVKTGADKEYNLIIENMYDKLSQGCKLFVFPSTSGLVASMNFQDKLKLWQDMVDKI